MAENLGMTRHDQVYCNTEGLVWIMLGIVMILLFHSMKWWVAIRNHTKMFSHVHLQLCLINGKLCKSWRKQIYLTLEQCSQFNGPCIDVWLPYSVHLSFWTIAAKCDFSKAHAWCHVDLVEDKEYCLSILLCDQNSIVTNFLASINISFNVSNIFYE